MALGGAVPPDGKPLAILVYEVRACKALNVDMELQKTRTDTGHCSLEHVHAALSVECPRQQAAGLPIDCDATD